MATATVIPQESSLAPSWLAIRTVSDIRPSRRRLDAVPKACLQDALDRLEARIILPILSSNNLKNDIEKLIPEYVELASLASLLVLRLLGRERALEQADKVFDLIAESIEQDTTECFDASGKQALLSGLQLASLVRRDFISFLKERGSLPIDEAKRLSGLPSWLTLYNLALHCAWYAMNSKRPELEPNAKVLAAWSFRYADAAYAEWGLVSLDIGRSAPLVEVS